MNLSVLNLEYREAWAKLLAVCFERELEDSLKLLDWLHQGFEPRAWGIWEESQLVAQYTALKRSLSYQNKIIHVGMSVNMAVHPDYRGRGYVKQIAAPVYEQLEAEGACFGLGFSNAEGVQVDKHSKSYGYRVIGQMRSIFAPVIPNDSPKLQTSAHFPDDCLSSLPMFSNMGFPKDCEYLFQRYAAHPFRQYHFAIWQEQGSTVGIVVYRPSKKMGISIASILDIWGEDLPELLRRFQAMASAQGFRLLHTLTSPKHPINGLLNWQIQAPYTHHPYYLTFKPLAENLSDDLQVFENWQFIGGDIL